MEENGCGQIDCPACVSRNRSDGKNVIFVELKENKDGK